jgi:hypothetical protein
MAGAGGASFGTGSRCLRLRERLTAGFFGSAGRSAAGGLGVENVSCADVVCGRGAGAGRLGGAEGRGLRAGLVAGFGGGAGSGVGAVVSGDVVSPGDVVWNAIEPPTPPASACDESIPSSASPLTANSRNRRLACRFEAFRTEIARLWTEAPILERDGSRRQYQVRVRIW